MTLALLVSMICLTGFAPPQQVMVTVVNLSDSPDAELCSNDAQCNLCGCWGGSHGCAITSRCGGCSYASVPMWGPWRMSDRDGCVDMDLLPVPTGGWVYWVKVP